MIIEIKLVRNRDAFQFTNMSFEEIRDWLGKVSPDEVEYVAINGEEIHNVKP